MSKRRKTTYSLSVDLGRVELQAIAARFGVLAPPAPALVQAMLEGMLSSDIQAITADYEAEQIRLAKLAEDKGAELRKARERGSVRLPRLLTGAAYFPPTATNEVPDGPNNGS